MCKNKKLIFETQSFVLKDIKGNESICSVDGGAYVLESFYTPYSKELKKTDIGLKSIKDEQ